MNLLVTGQETPKVSVANQLFGVQLGYLSASVQYEFKLDRKLTLLSDAGVSFISSSRENASLDNKKESASVLYPYLTLEPRWYFGLDRRQRLGKNTKNNSSNFLAVSMSYHSAHTPLIKSGDFGIVSAANFIPRFGIRRSFAKNFNYEFSGGVGYQYNIFNKNECSCEHNNTTIDIQARIGYNF